MIKSYGKLLSRCVSSLAGDLQLVLYHPAVVRRRGRESRGGIWSCIYGTGEVLSARSTSGFSCKNRKSMEKMIRSSWNQNRKLLKNVPPWPIIFDKFRTPFWVWTWIARVSLWRGDAGQNSAVQVEYIRPRSGGGSSSSGGRGARGSLGVQYGLSRGAPPPPAHPTASGPHFIARHAVQVLNLSAASKPRSASSLHAKTPPLLTAVNRV